MCFAIIKSNDVKKHNKQKQQMFFATESVAETFAVLFCEELVIIDDNFFMAFLQLNSQFFNDGIT